MRNGSTWSRLRLKSGCWRPEVRSHTGFPMAGVSHCYGGCTSSSNGGVFVTVTGVVVDQIIECNLVSIFWITPGDVLCISK